MSPSTATNSLSAIRTVVVITIHIIEGILVWILFHRGGQAAFEPLYTLSILLVALATYSWVLESLALSIYLTGIVMMGLLWTWAAWQLSPFLGWNLVVFFVLVVSAAAERGNRARRLHRLTTAIGDLVEERRVKEQALSQAVQSREALSKKLSRYAQLQSIAETLSNMTELADISQLAVDRAFTLIGKSDACLLFLVDTQRQELSLFTSKKRDALMNIRSKHGDQFDRYVLRTHRPLLVNDVRRDFRFTVNLSMDRAIASVIACPMLVGQSPEGILRLDSTQPSSYTQDDLRFLDIFLDLVSTAVTNAQLFAKTQQLAMTDGLTGLTLRRPFMEALGRELLRTTRSRESLGVLMLDVDNFKQYNDTFGHTAGDVVLRSVAKMVQEAVPAGTMIARYGGEEFAVLLPRTSSAEAGETAERIRHLIEEGFRSTDAAHAATREAKPTSRGIRMAKEHRQVTVSIGVSSFPADAQMDLELIRVADQRLYQAKRAGRNRVCAS